jgi:hypothetical protein
VRQGDQSADQVGSAAGHPHVGDHEHRAVLVRDRHRVVAGDGLTDDAEVRLLLEERGQRWADAGVVGGGDDGDLTADGRLHRQGACQSRSICPDACASVV